MNYLDFIINNKSYFEDFVTRNTYHSNAIEGSTLSVDETYALLFDSKHCDIVHVNPREIYEAINHKKALLFLLNSADKKELLSKELLITINQMINENIMYVGGYRLGPIRIIGSEKKFPIPEELEEKMNQLIDDSNHLINSDFSMLSLAKLHVNFENIHPFPDGNGRTGRLLLNYLLLMKNECPIVIPMSKRKEYLECMEKNDYHKLSNMFTELQQQEEERIQDFKQI